MGYIREKVGSDIFLYSERLVETIDRLDEWCELVISSIDDTLIPRAIDIGLESIYDEMYRNKYSSYPPEVDPDDEREEHEIGSEESHEECDDESKLWSISRPTRRIGDDRRDIGK